MFEAVLAGLFGFMDAILGIAFLLPASERVRAMAGVLAISALVSGIVLYVNSKVLDTGEMKRLKKRIGKLQEEMREAQKKEDSKRAAKLQKELMDLNMKIMPMSMRPMMYTMVPIILIFQWLRRVPLIEEVIREQGYLVELPFPLPHYGAQLGWLGWYILCSFLTSTLIKKFLDIEY
jgi:uncharacterized membrane protein (DUF106 family)